VARETSAVAYETKKASGMVESVAARVLRLVRERGPLTSRQIWEMEFEQEGKHLTDAVRPRIFELAHQGLLREAGKETSRSTGIEGLLWEAVPEAEVKPLVAKESWKAKALRLQAENEDLRSQLREHEEKVFKDI
jgi:hypothetical protein